MALIKTRQPQGRHIATGSNSPHIRQSESRFRHTNRKYEHSTAQRIGQTVVGSVLAATVGLAAGVAGAEAVTQSHGGGGNAETTKSQRVTKLAGIIIKDYYSALFSNEGMERQSQDSRSISMAIETGKGGQVTMALSSDKTKFGPYGEQPDPNSVNRITVTDLGEKGMKTEVLKRSDSGVWTSERTYPGHQYGTQTEVITNSKGQTSLYNLHHKGALPPPVSVSSDPAFAEQQFDVAYAQVVSAEHDALNALKHPPETPSIPTPVGANS